MREHPGEPGGDGSNELAGPISGPAVQVRVPGMKRPKVGVLGRLVRPEVEFRPGEGAFKRISTRESDRAAKALLDGLRLRAYQERAGVIRVGDEGVVRERQVSEVADPDRPLPTIEEGKEIIKKFEEERGGDAKP